MSDQINQLLLWLTSLLRTLIYHIGLVARKHVFGETQTTLKPASSATETSYNIEISPVASLNMILSQKHITKVLIRMRGCAGWSAPLLFANPEDRFSPVKAIIIRLRIVHAIYYLIWTRKSGGHFVQQSRMGLSNFW